MASRRGTLALALLFSVLSAASLGIGLLSLGPILKVILDPQNGASLASLAAQHNAQAGAWSIPQNVVQMLPTEPFASVAWLIGGIALLTVFGAIANFMHQYLSQTLTTHVVADVRQDAFEHVIHMPLSRVITRGPSEFVARIVRDAAELQRGLIALTSKALAQITKGVAAFAVALLIDWRLTMVALPSALVLAIVLRKIGKRIRRGTRGSLEAQEGLLRVATESLQGLRAVKANTAEAEARDRFRRINNEVVRHELRIRLARALSSPLLETLAVFALAALALVAARQIISGSMPFDRFMLALGSLAVSGASFRPLAGLINEVQAAAAPAQRLTDILSEPQETIGDSSRRDLPLHAASLSFENVLLRYPGADRPALDGLSLRIAHGERVALVGPNGCGKTTLVSLIPRLLTPSAGRVLVDDIDIASVTLTSLRAQIGVVTQETVLFRGTVAENIAFGRKDVSRSDIIDAARKAHADSFIQSLHGGYDADLAEQGASLSGGQRQRLAIARAILRDPAILILDEATSQIDAESERHISAAIEDFGAGRTLIIVAHRLATVLSADRIVVMHQGRVVDQGTHAELLERCDLYRRLAKTQLAGEPSSAR